MTPRRLHAADAPAWQALRLRGLRESPSAFGSTYEEEADRPMDGIAAHLAPGAQGDELDVETTNAPAGALYRAFGFVPRGVQPDACRDAGQSWDSELMWMAIRSAP